jgi:hypothetical protein
MKKVLLSFILACSLSVGVANATYIVDTGASSAYSNQWMFRPLESFAAKFTVTSSYTINSVESYMRNYPGQTPLLSAQLYSNGTDIANTFSGSALFSSALFGVGTSDNWYGISGLDWTINAGTYWLAFNVASDSHDYDPSYFELYAPMNPIHPLESYATKGYSWATYLDESAYQTSLRISGVDYNSDSGSGGGSGDGGSGDGNGGAAPVPEPGTIALLGLGMAGLAVYGKRRQKNSQA